MSDMRITGGVSPYLTQKSGMNQTAKRETTEEMQQSHLLPAVEKKESKSLHEMIQEAREKAEKRREQFKLPKNTRYGDGPMEAYAKLARAKNAAQVNSAAGFARRRIAQLRTALRQDPDNASQIKAAINQLQKAVGRASKKKKELSQEQLTEARRRKAQSQQREREAQRLKLENNRRQAQRSIRESGYIREAEIDSRMQQHIAAMRMELQSQAQALAKAYPEAAQSVPAVQAAQYAAPAATEAPAPQIDIQA